MAQNVDERWQEYEATGEEQVRKNFANYGPKQRPVVEAWLAHRERLRSAESERLRQDSTAEQLRIARSAKNAAIVAATAATIAAICATIAIGLNLMK